MDTFMGFNCLNKQLDPIREKRGIDCWCTATKSAFLRWSSKARRKNQFGHCSHSTERPQTSCWYQRLSAYLQKRAWRQTTAAFIPSAFDAPKIVFLSFFHGNKLSKMSVMQLWFSGRGDVMMNSEDKNLNPQSLQPFEEEPDGKSIEISVCFSQLSRNRHSVFSLVTPPFHVPPPSPFAPPSHAVSSQHWSL